MIAEGIAFVCFIWCRSLFVWDSWISCLHLWHMPMIT